MMLQTIQLYDFTLQTGQQIDVQVSYQLFGKELHSAPIVMINHALTGNSEVSGDFGWWKEVVGLGKTIDINRFTVLCINIPGNGFDGFYFDENSVVVTSDIAKIFLQTLEILNINSLECLIGGSIGGSIAWQMLAYNPDLCKYFIPIATDYKTTDWLHSQCLLQQFLLESSENPLYKARIHAMLCYRTPESLNNRFQRNKTENNVLKSFDWLNYHGEKFTERFSLKAYRLVNNLLINIDVEEESLKNISAHIHLIAVNSDLFYPAFEVKNTFELLQNTNRINYHEIKSMHGHDAFLIEYEQLNSILSLIIQ